MTMQQPGKYKILEELGHGGFATVYRAVDTTLEREVALKVLAPLLMRDEAWVERFRREARAVARLKHPHIVTIYEIGEIQDRLFIAAGQHRVPGTVWKQRVTGKKIAPHKKTATTRCMTGSMDNLERLSTESNNLTIGQFQIETRNPIQRMYCRVCSGYIFHLLKRRDMIKVTVCSKNHLNLEVLRRGHDFFGLITRINDYPLVVRYQEIAIIIESANNDSFNIHSISTTCRIKL